MNKRVSLVVGGLVVGLMLLGSLRSESVADGHSSLQPLSPGVFVDWEHGQLEATGSCAADLYAASADIARVKAERLARLRAEERLRRALAQLSHDEKQRARLVPYGGAEPVGRLDPTRARRLSVDYAATGSVSLRLVLPLSSPPPLAVAADLGSSSPLPDAGQTKP